MARKAALKSTDADSANTERLRVVNNLLKLRIDDLKTFDPLTDNQKLFFDAYKRGDYFVALHGVAGTGKTFCALYKALEEVMDKSNPFRKIIVVRSAVQSREVGHLGRSDGHEAELTADGRIRLEVIPGTTHFLPMERPDLVRQTLSGLVAG